MKERFLLVLGFASLVSGIAAGLARSGLEPVPVGDDAVVLHGALMVCGFFGTVICLERAVAFGRLWSYAAPLACGLGGIAFVAGAARTGLWLMAAGSLVLLAASVLLTRRQSSLESWTLAGGAGCWLAGNAVIALGAPVAAAVPWWLAFFALTIGAERLELSRYMPRPGAAQWFFGGIVLFLITSSFFPIRMIGVPLVALAAWLFAWDIARKTVQGRGLARYIALCLLAGYAWLALGGALLALGIGYDAPLHAILVGFVFSMVFGHAPVIVPAVLRIALPYSRWMYLPLALLHASLALRVAGGLAGEAAWRLAGSAGNALAIAAFIVTAGLICIKARRRLPGSLAP
jgi:hypothetical protein